jgi:hypothetical protein
LKSIISSSFSFIFVNWFCARTISLSVIFARLSLRACSSGGGSVPQSC